MSLIIVKAIEKVLDTEFLSTSEAIKYAEEKLANIPEGYQVVRVHSDVFHVEQVTQSKIVFTKEVSDECSNQV